MPGGIPFDLWRDTIDHIEEPKKVAALGSRAYEAFYGEDVSTHQENLELLPARAGLAHKTFRYPSRRPATALKECPEGKAALFQITFLGGTRSPRGGRLRLNR